MNNYPFDIKVSIYRRPNIRDESLEYELYVGRGILENLFDHKVIDTSTSKIVLSFPERWLNIIEERSLYSRIELFYPNVKEVLIKTQSVYIIQSTPAGCCFITCSQEEQDYLAKNNVLPQESKDGVTSFQCAGNFFDATKLNVVY